MASKDKALEDPLLTAQGPEGSDVGDEKSDSKLVIVGDHGSRSHGQVSIFEADSAATSVVTELCDFILQDVLVQVISG